MPIELFVPHSQVLARDDDQGTDDSLLGVPGGQALLQQRL